MSLVPFAPRRNKYQAIRTTVEGISFASKAEARRFSELRLLERGGAISELKLQVPYPLSTPKGPVLLRSGRYPNGRQAKYVADFTYVENGVRVVEDTKGLMTDLSRHKIAHIESEYGVRVLLGRVGRK